MVFVLVALTVAIFVATDWYLRRQRRVPAASEMIPAREGIEPRASVQGPLYVHPGHSWVRVAPDGDVAVGTSPFASCFAGRLDSVELPGEGTRLNQGDPGWTLVSRRNRRLTQVMPVAGDVIEVNHALLANPDLAQRAPYDLGWMLRIRPKHLTESLQNLLHGGLAQAWEDATRARLSQVLSPALGARANDGGEWIAGFGDGLSDTEWETLRREMFPAVDDENPD